MALQGTLDTFALADLVRLLATTEKTGELAIDGDRGQGRLWFADGEIVGGEPSTADVVDALFALLRMEEGDFRFEPDVAPDEPGDPRRALDVLQAAEERLEAWRPVEALVPGLGVTLALRDDVEAEEVRVDRDTWRHLVVVARSATAADLATALDLDEVAASFLVRDLVETGLVEVGDPVETTATVEPAPDDEVFVPVEVEDVPLPGEAEALAVREARIEETVAEDAVAAEAWSPESLPTISSAAELLGTEGPLADDLAGAEADADGLGPWEPLTPPAEDGEHDAPATLAEALPPVADALPSLDAVSPLAPAVDAPAVEDALPSVDEAPTDAVPPAPTSVPGSLAVDLDAQLGGAAGDHSYLGGADAGALPEPLPSAPVGALDATDGDGAAEGDADRAPWPSRNGSGHDEVPLGALSPAAAAAVAAAASESSGEELETGRGVLRRIISTGKG